MAIFDNLDRALRWLREGRRRRQYQVAEDAGITKAMLSAYETGKQKPSVETLDKLLVALGCDLVDLHEALAVFSSSGGFPAGKSPAPGARSSRPDALPGRGTAATRAAEREDAAGAGIGSALGIEEPLGGGEEEALEEVLASFHKLLRHLHGAARRAARPEDPHDEGS